MLNKRDFYINGSWIPPVNQNDYEVINPSNEEPFATISLGDAADTDAAVKAAKISFESWRKISKEKKIDLIQKLYEVYESRWDEMSQIISKEMGAPIDWATEQQTASGAGHIKAFIKTLKNFEFEKKFEDQNSELMDGGIALLVNEGRSSTEKIHIKGL